MFQRSLFLLVCASLALSACTASNEAERSYPQSDRDERRAERGKLTGESGLSILGGGDSKEAAGSPLGVNSFLWRATLDTLSFMPFASADPFGGVILTDWYEDPKAPGERYKVNAIILDKTLRADGVRITVFKQKLEGGSWRDQPADERLSRSLEDTVLTRARQLRLAQLGR